MTSTYKGYNIQITVAVCYSGTQNVIDEFDTMAEAKAYAKEEGLDADYWYMAAEEINVNGDLGSACWGKTRSEALSKLKKALG